MNKKTRSLAVHVLLPAEPLRRLFASLMRRWRIRLQREFAAQEIMLPPHTTAGFTVPRQGVRITCLSGTLWVTCSGHPKDYLLTAGQYFLLRSRGRLTVDAMAALPARLLLERSAKPRAAQRLASSEPQAATSPEIAG